MDTRTVAGTAPAWSRWGAPDPGRLFSGRWYGRVGGARGRWRVHGGALLLGPLMFRWTTCVRLDHLRAVGPPGSRNRVVQRHLSGPTEHKWSKRTGRVTTCETPSHHAGRPVGRSRCGGRNRPAARTVRLPGPDDPSEPDRRSHRPSGTGGRRSHGPADPLDAEGPAGITTLKDVPGILTGVDGPEGKNND